MTQAVREGFELVRTGTPSEERDPFTGELLAWVVLDGKFRAVYVDPEVATRDFALRAGASFEALTGTALYEVVGRLVAGAFGGARLIPVRLVPAW